MLNKIKIWHFIVLVIGLIIILRFGYVIDLLTVYYLFFQTLLAGKENVNSFITFPFIDNFISICLIFVLPIVILGSAGVKNKLSSRLKFSNIFIVLLLVSFVFAPIITKQHPDFQKNISVTKLLPPFSSSYYILLNQNNKEESVLDNKLKDLIDSKIPKSFNDEIIFLDSSSFDSAFKYYQSGVLSVIDINKLKTENDKPFIGTKLFILGTDEFGRDVFTRIVYGCRISIIIGMGAVFVSFFLGIILAFIASQIGGLLRILINRIADLFLTFPSIFLVVLILALFGSNILSIIIVLGFSGWMSLFKIASSEIISLKQKEFFLTAEQIGLKKLRLLIREVLPVIIVPVIVNLIFQLSNVILAESALSYLGLGTGSEYSSWGSMIESGQEYITQSWWLIFIPGITLIITLLSINEAGRKFSQKINPTIR